MDAHSVLGIVGNVFAAALFLSPAITFYRVLRTKSTEEFSGIPYVASFLCCILYVWYGSPMVTTNNFLVLMANGIGGILELFYITIYLIYAPSKYRVKVGCLFVGAWALFFVIVAVSGLAMYNPGRALFAGIVAAFFSICMFGSPLSIMKLVYDTKSVEYMPFLLSLSVFLCSTTWFVYGIIGNDLFVMIPNGVGSLLGTAQLILYAIYFKSTKRSVDRDASEALLDNA